eukprot:1161710-Pelagomonas_calceolata.AAC.1
MAWAKSKVPDAEFMNAGSGSQVRGFDAVLVSLACRGWGTKLGNRRSLPTTSHDADFSAPLLNKAH